MDLQPICTSCISTNVLRNFFLNQILRCHYLIFDARENAGAASGWLIYTVLGWCGCGYRVIWSLLWAWTTAKNMERAMGSAKTGKNDDRRRPSLILATQWPPTTSKRSGRYIRMPTSIHQPHNAKYGPGKEKTIGGPLVVPGTQCRCIQFRVWNWCDTWRGRQQPFILLEIFKPIHGQ